VNPSRFGLPLAIACALLLAGHAAWAKGERRFAVKVTVAEISDAAGEIDPRAKRLDQNLRGSSVPEPGVLAGAPESRARRGRRRRASERPHVPGPPLNLGERGLLMAVGWEGE
jgi:hypothetical protein